MDQCLGQLEIIFISHIDKHQTSLVCFLKKKSIWSRKKMRKFKFQILTITMHLRILNLKFFNFSLIKLIFFWKINWLILVLLYRYLGWIWAKNEPILEHKINPFIHLVINWPQSLLTGNKLNFILVVQTCLS